MTQSTLQSSRRAFLKTGAAGVMTLGVGGMAQAATTAKALPKWDKEFDVIVVGSGLAGYCAGITAAELGRKTVILEKMAVPGGSSVISGGTFAACNTKRQQKEGVKDSVELYVKDVLKAGGRLNVPELVQTMCEQSNEAFEFLVERGAQYNEELRKVAGHTVKRCFQPLYNNGLSVIQPLHRHYLKLKNTSLQLRTKVDEIIRDQKGRAVGVKVREAYIFDPESKADDRLNKTGVVKFYKAKRGLVFATGGFSRDFEFRQREFPQYNKVPSTVSCGATAGALKLMMKAGARSIHLAHVRFAISIGFEDIEKGILVDQRTGKRFINEGAPRMGLSYKIIDTVNAGSDWPALIYDEAFHLSKHFVDSRDFPAVTSCLAVAQKRVHFVEQKKGTVTLGRFKSVGNELFGYTHVAAREFRTGFAHQGNAEFSCNIGRISRLARARRPVDAKTPAACSTQTFEKVIQIELGIDELRRVELRQHRVVVNHTTHALRFEHLVGHFDDLVVTWRFGRFAGLANDVRNRSNHCA